MNLRYIYTHPQLNRREILDPLKFIEFDGTKFPDVSKRQTHVMDGSPRTNTWQAPGGLSSSDGGSMVSAPLIDSVIVILGFIWIVESI